LGELQQVCGSHWVLGNVEEWVVEGSSVVRGELFWVDSRGSGGGWNCCWVDVCNYM